MTSNQVCASCLTFSVDKIVKSTEELKPTWLQETDHVKEFIKNTTDFRNRLPSNIDTSLKINVGKIHSGKKLLFWGTKKSRSDLKIKDALKAYGSFENNGIVTVNKHGDVVIKLSCPQIYTVQKTFRHKPDAFFRHFHFVLSNKTRTKWSPQLYTKIIVCHHDYHKTMKLHKNKQCILINTLPCEYYGKDHIPKSYNLPHDTIKKLSQKRLFSWMKDIINNHYPKIAEAISNGDLDIKELPIVVYCAHNKCGSSGIAAEELMKKGCVNISEYKGGMREYNSKSSALLGYSQKGGYIESKQIISTVLKKDGVLVIEPIPHHSLPLVSPFPKVTCGDLIRCVLKKTSTQRDRDEWRPHVRNVVSQINTLFNDGNIPIGTKLYHGSLSDSLNFFNEGKYSPFFFGIEESISLWYIYEMWLSQNKRNNTNGWLYTLEVTKPISITKLIEQIITHPTEDDDCWVNAKGVCIHPQQIFHGETDTIKDLGIEITLRPDIFKDNLKLVDKQHVDIQEIINLVDTYEN